MIVHKRMVYLEYFRFPSFNKEDSALNGLTSIENFFNKSMGQLYPFRILSTNDFQSIEFSPITFLYGGNGSGKSTALNVISNTLHIKRDSPYNTSMYMDEYIKLCSFKTNSKWSGEEFNFVGERQAKYDIAEVSRMITSDDIFKSVMDFRINNDQKLYKSKILSKEISIVKGIGTSDKDKRYETIKSINPDSGENLEEYKRFWAMKKATSFSQYLTSKLGRIERGFSNGENSMMYLAEEIKQAGLYLLDEPENSMSCKFQKQLAEIIEYSAVHCNSQFIIATHSPFLLAIPDAKIYNLDADPVCVSKFWELDNMVDYYYLFESFSEQIKQTMCESE